MGEPAKPPVGVLLAQLGTPEAPTTSALRSYLAEFLSDRRVVDLPRPLWWCILHGIILRTRPSRSAALYRNIWTDEGSPLLVTSERQASRLQELLDEAHPGACKVALGMRYGRPGLPSALEQLLVHGCERILLFPLYPQYSVATTASVLDRVFADALRRYDVPTLRVVPPFPEHPAYIDALAARVRASLTELPDVLLISFHGEPVSYREAGDPYYDHCLRTARALEASLELEHVEIRTVFQSRFGGQPWLQPYLDVTLEELGAAGTGHVAVVMPGFVADCLETIDEVGREGREAFQASGGGRLTRIPCLNEDETWMQALTAIALENLQSWL